MSSGLAEIFGVSGGGGGLVGVGTEGPVDDVGEASFERSDDNLSGADLSGSNLSGSNLMGADLAAATLDRATTEGTNLHRITWSNATCPDGTNSDNDSGTCVHDLWLVGAGPGRPPSPPASNHPLNRGVKRGG